MSDYYQSPRHTADTFLLALPALKDDRSVNVQMSVDVGFRLD